MFRLWLIRLLTFLHSVPTLPNDGNKEESACAASTKFTCYFCGFRFHPHLICPAREAICRKCKEEGHYQRVCRSKDPASSKSTTASLFSPLLGTAFQNGVPKSLRKSSIPVQINRKEAIALIDSGSSDRFIHPSLVEACSLLVCPSTETISMATKTLTARIQRLCSADIEIDKRIYPGVKLHVFPDLCADIILGQDWQAKYESVTIRYGGKNLQQKYAT